MKMYYITGVRYAKMFQNYVIPELQQRNVVCMDGTPPHVASSIRQLLQQHIGDRIFSCNFAVLWPLQSLDLTLIDFWLYGYLK